MIRLTVLLLALNLWSGIANGQLEWKMTHPPVIGSLHYAFTAISCNGQNCTAACRVTDTSTPAPPKIWIRFVRSTDDGLTWSDQDPELPYEIVRNSNYISQIQQIDSLNVIGAGDSGLIVRTFDGGATWRIYNVPTVYPAEDISFSDSANGIFISAGYTTIWITSDGGRSWVSPSFQEIGFTQCHSSESGIYQAFKYDFGEIYSTFDNWHSIDSLAPPFDTLTTPDVLGHCIFSRDGSFLAATGNQLGSNGATPIIFVSSDSGHQWTKASNVVGPIPNYMSDVDHDTIIAGSLGAGNLLVSTDRGFTWALDTIILDTGFACNQTNGLAMTGDGHPLAVFYRGPFDNFSIIIRGEVANEIVLENNQTIPKVKIFPNPASATALISASGLRGNVHLFDVLGGEVLSEKLAVDGTCLLDLSSLSDGIYEVVIEENGGIIASNKISLMK